LLQRRKPLRPGVAAVYGPIRWRYSRLCGEKRGGSERECDARQKFSNIHQHTPGTWFASGRAQDTINYGVGPLCLVLSFNKKAALISQSGFFPFDNAGSDLSRTST
jgi:hypothetical protein